jgi:hypothetical protein
LAASGTVVGILQEMKVSKLTDLITAKQGHERYAMPASSFIDIRSELEETKDYSTPFAIGYRYRIEARFGFTSTFIVPEALPHVLKDAKDAINHEIFGEFREPLLFAKMALHKGDAPLAIKYIDDIMKAMFHA